MQDTMPQKSRQGIRQHQPYLLAVSHCMQGKHHNPQQPVGETENKAVEVYQAAPSCKIVLIVAHISFFKR